MRLAIVGCGYVADMYVKTLPLHPELELVGVTDRDAEKVKRFSTYYSVPAYRNFEELLADDRVQIVLNLTNPASHYEVTRACLKAGKHVYSEKPLAMYFEQSKELAALAGQKSLHLSCAPCSVLNEGAQTFWKALREEKVGKVRLAYAEMDDGLLHRMPYQKWVSESGNPWPYKDEFEVGCTLEHAGYLVTWLAAFFGPAQSVTAFSSIVVPDKQSDVPLDVNTVDFSVACIKFNSGVVARLTCGIMAPRDHSITAFGDSGVMTLKDVSDDRSPVRIRRYHKIRRRLLLNPLSSKFPMVGKSNPRAKYRGAQKRNFARGIAELADAIREGRSSRLAADYCLHINEIVLAIHNAQDTATPHRLTTTFSPMAPMPYAQDGLTALIRAQGGQLAWFLSPGDLELPARR